MTKIGLILSGGGARASYQVGVLKAVAEIGGNRPNNPFKVISGTSAGAINATSLACHSDDFSRAVHRLENLWGELDSEDVHNTGFGELIKSTSNLISSFFHSGVAPKRQLFLLDNSPLRRLLQASVEFGRLSDRIANGDIWAVGVTALEYRTGHTIHFFQANPEVEEWQRHRRIGRRAQLTLEHLMASTAIPGVYPAVKIGGGYFGDGAVRDTAPMSAALHLGADKLFVIGASHSADDDGEEQQPAAVRSPSAGQIVSHLFNRSFIDTMEEDVERLQLLNDVVERLSEADRREVGVKQVEVMDVIPGLRIDELAAQHISTLPRSMRTFFRTVGATGESGGASAASYLLFESAFLHELMQSGYRDGMEKRQEIEAFLAAET